MPDLTLDSASPGPPAVRPRIVLCFLYDARVRLRQFVAILENLRQSHNASMRYQYKREPLTGDEATRLANACNPHEEKLVVWVLLDTGLRVSELANLKRANLDWQTHRLMGRNGS